MQRRQASLGSRIVCQLRGAEVADDRRDIDNGPAAAAAQNGREECLEAVEWAEQVGRQTGVYFFQGEVQERFPNDDSRVVDEDCRFSELW